MSDQIDENLRAILARLDRVEQHAQRKLTRIEALLWLILSATIIGLAAVVGPGAMIFLLIAGFIVVAIVTLSSNGPHTRQGRRPSQ
jgi:hypothetical protein